MFANFQIHSYLSIIFLIAIFSFDSDQLDF